MWDIASSCIAKDFYLGWFPPRRVDEIWKKSDPRQVPIVWVVFLNNLGSHTWHTLQGWVAWNSGKGMSDLASETWIWFHTSFLDHFKDNLIHVFLLENIAYLRVSFLRKFYILISLLLPFPAFLLESYTWRDQLLWAANWLVLNAPGTSEKLLKNSYTWASGPLRTESIQAQNRNDACDDTECRPKTEQVVQMVTSAPIRMKICLGHNWTPSSPQAS